MSIEKILYNFRKVNKYSQKEAAVLLGVSQVTLHYWESGIHQPSGRNLKRIYDTCGGHIGFTTINYLEELNMVNTRLSLLELELKNLKEKG